MGNSRKDLSALPAGLRRTIGHGLRQVQNGETPDFAKPLQDFGSLVMELRTDFNSDTYRAVYIAKLRSAVYVLDVFRKKSTKGSNLPKGHRIGGPTFAASRSNVLSVLESFLLSELPGAGDTQGQLQSLTFETARGNAITEKLLQELVDSNEAQASEIAALREQLERLLAR